MASTLREGDFVREGRSCSTPEARDRLTSNGHSVSPPGQQCRVISRTSSGAYYPIFNQRCTGGAAGDYPVDLHVQGPDHITLRWPEKPNTVTFRHCPAAGVAHAQ